MDTSVKKTAYKRKKIGKSIFKYTPRSCEVRNVREESKFCCFLTLGVWMILIMLSNVAKDKK